jgi:probable rRNA maturation factor
LTISGRVGSNYVPYLRRHLRKAHVLLRPKLRELSVALVNDRTMSELHQRYMRITGPTDVLTFELEHDARRHVIAGEVIICVPFARRAAPTDTKRELLLYALHGMLHLCGFDDRTAAAYRAMHREEDRILERLGIGRVFDRASAGGARR